MTTPTTNPPSRTSDPGQSSAERAGGPASSNQLRIFAVVHERAAGVAVVVAELPAPGRSLRLLQARRFTPGPGQVAGIRGLLRERAVDLVIRIAPTAQTLVRTTKLPEQVADRTALADAMALVAESELPSHLPWYRRTGGVVTEAPSGDSPSPRQTGLVVGWNKTGSPVPDHLAEAVEGYRQLWSTEPVALAWLLLSVPEPAASPTAASEFRWVAAMDRASGAAALAASSNEKTLMRVLRLPSSDPARWRDAATQAIAEAASTLAPADHPAPASAILDADRSLAFSPGLTFSIAGESRDAAWLAEFGIPAALAAVFAPSDPAARALFNLHATEPRQRLGLLTGLVTWLSRPARAAAVIGLCVAALLLVPLGVAYARHTTLQRHIAGVTGLEERLTAAEQRVAFYSLLREKRWPMTKLIADIAASTPVGVTLDVLEITQGEPITLRGTAENNELVTTFRENLGKTRVFESIATPSVTSTADGIQFQLSARASSAGVVYRGNPVDDFAAKPLGARMYGDSYVPPGEEEGEHGDAPRPRKHRTSGSNGAGTHVGESTTRSSSPPAASRNGSSGSADKPAPIVPPPLSNDEIQQLDRTGAMMEFAKRKKAAGQQGLDPATKARLLDESEKAKERMNELNKAPKGGAS